MRLRGLLCCLIAVLVGSGDGEERVARTDLPQKLDAELAKRAKELGVVGATAALYRRGELVWSGAAGKADIAARRAMTAQTPVAYASVGKMINAALALRLADEDAARPTRARRRDRGRARDVLPGPGESARAAVPACRLARGAAPTAAGGFIPLQQLRLRGRWAGAAARRGQLVALDGIG
jgi:Beta-lactamase